MLCRPPSGQALKTFKGRDSTALQGPVPVPGCMQQGRGSVRQPEPLPVWLKPRVSCCEGPSCRFSIASLLGDAGAAFFPAELAPVSQPLLTGPVLQLPHLGGPLLSELLLVLVFPMLGSGE